MNLGVIILAAGNGTRMQSNLPKVLHEFAGTPILIRIIATILSLENISQIVIVAGAHIEALKLSYNKALMEGLLGKSKSIITWADQQFPLGTADAVVTGLAKINSNIDNILVVSGDLPLISSDSLYKLINHTPKLGVGLITANSFNPYGFGRIVRDSTNNFLKIVEQLDATPIEASINEINVGVYLFPQKFLRQNLPKINNDNLQKEYYITDILELAVTTKLVVHILNLNDSLEAYSINTRKQLIELNRAYQLQQAYNLIDNGVTIIDPSRLDIRGEIQISQDVEIDINVILVGKVIIAQGAKIGANCFIQDAFIGKEVIIKPNTVIQGASIENQAIIGPFARIRPKTYIRAKAKIGNFVEIKASDVGSESKVNHLNYIGDALIGKQVNIGAGSITCNYDGVHKHRTVIEDQVFIGAGCQLVAPITLGENATIAAGTTLLKDAANYKLTLNKKIQYSVEWQRPTELVPANISRTFTETSDQS